MGIYSTAHLVYGWRILSDPLNVPPDHDLTEWLEERLEGGPFDFYLDGNFEWDDGERDLVLTIRGAPAFSACEATETISSDVFGTEVSGALDRELRREAKDRLGITLEGDPKWYLGCTIG